MTDLKALRQQIVSEIFDSCDPYTSPTEDVIEDALLRYAKAALGEPPSEGMKVAAGDFGDGYELSGECVVRLYNVMAAQRMKEIE